MADSSNIVALNIGSQRIGMAVFEATKGGSLLLKGYASETIVADPALESSRIGQIRVAVGDLAQRLKVSKSKVRYAIAGQAAFTRFVKLPPIQMDNIEELVCLEAQQHVPFPIDEVVWDYEMIESGGEKEVVIVAIKGEVLDELNAAVNESGMATAEVDVAPMALYNAFIASYGAPAEPVLLIDVGAKTSNLLYIEGKRFFTRNIPVGGASLTAAVAKEYDVSFAEAEHQKIANGLVALGSGHTEQLDESVAALAMSLRNALSRLPSEITRNTNYYRSQHGGNAPKRVYLCGGGANLPYTLEFFEEKLNLPVEFFNPLKSISIGKNVDTSVLQREAHLMGELIGLGLRAIGKSSINIDLVPAAVEQIRAADKRKPFLIAAAAILLAGVAAWSAFNMMAANKAREEADARQHTREIFDPLAGQVDSLLKAEASLGAIAASYTNEESDHVFWPDLLNELSGTFASESVWLTDIEPLSGYDPLTAKAAPGAAGKGKTGAPEVQAAKSIVNSTFPTIPYGSSPLAEDRSGDDDAGAKKGAPAVDVSMANAVRIRGFWRQNKDSQNAVYKLLAKLREKPSAFKFVFDNSAGKPEPLKDEQIITTLKSQLAEGDFASPFEMVLPLARPISAR